MWLAIQQVGSIIIPQPGLPDRARGRIPPKLTISRFGECSSR